jgi:ATP-dependent NAD(P)H-hydrate dehydratase
LTLPKYSTLLTNDSPVILTPNVMERRRLAESSVVLPDTCLVIEKGPEDRIVRCDSTSNGGSVVSMVCNEKGGLKRSGGIGDILAGTCGTLMAWNRILTADGTASADDLPLACWTACCFVKRSTRRTYEMHRRSMTAPDILQELGPTIDEMTSCAVE